MLSKQTLLWFWIFDKIFSKIFIKYFRIEEERTAEEVNDWAFDAFNAFIREEEKMFAN